MRVRRFTHALSFPVAANGLRAGRKCFLHVFPHRMNGTSGRASEFVPSEFIRLDEL